MTYSLAIDVGTNSIQAAVAEWGPEGLRQVRPVHLGTSADVAPNLVFGADNGRLLVGEEANCRGLAEPGRLIRGYKQRVGDPVPLRIGEHRCPAEQVLATATSWARNTAIMQEGSDPASLVVSVPPTWGELRTSLYQRALIETGVEGATLVPETVAALTYFASRKGVSEESTFAVFNLGAEFRATVLKANTDGSYKILSHDDSTDPIGSADFDDAVLRQVLGKAGIGSVAQDTLGNDQQAFADVRRRCTLAKEELSTNTDVEILLSLSEAQQRVRLTRGEFEDSIRAHVDESITALLQTVDRAGVRHEDLAAIVLIGGSSRVPLVARMISERTNRPVFVDADSHAAVSLGAALTASPPVALQQTTSEAPSEGVAELNPQQMNVSGRSRVRRSPSRTATSGVPFSQFPGRIAAAAAVAVLSAITLTGAQGPTERLVPAASVQGGDTPRFPIGQARPNVAATEAAPDEAAPGLGTPPEPSTADLATFPGQVPSSPPTTTFPLEPGSDPAAADTEATSALLMPASTTEAATTPPTEAATIPPAEAASKGQGQSAAPESGDASGIVPAAPDAAPEGTGTLAPVNTAAPIEPAPLPTEASPGELPTETSPVELPEEAPSTAPTLPAEAPSTPEAVE